MVAKKSVRALHSVNIQVYIYNLHQKKLLKSNAICRSTLVYVRLLTRLTSTCYKDRFTYFVFSYICFVYATKLCPLTFISSIKLQNH